ncbi:MAG: transporter substrate-binding domain-containing protein [Desulfobacterium sp.]|nr:transporter substrate-binding domain-containing protein [Desulfobacterium sp.]
MRIQYATGYEPFSFSDDGHGARGILVDLMDEILGRQMGIPIVHEICPWARCQHRVEHGKRDAFFTIPTPRRRGYTTVSRLPVFSSPYILFTGVNNPRIDEIRRIKSLDELRKHTNLSNACILGGGWHKTNLKGVKHLSQVLNSTKIMELLKHSRADIYIEQTLLVRYQLKQLGMQADIVEIPNVMDMTHWHLCIGKKSPFVNLMPAIDKKLEQMQQSGALKKLQEKIFRKYK